MSNESVTENIQNFSCGIVGIYQCKVLSVSPFFVLNTAERLICACKGGRSQTSLTKKRMYGMYNVHSPNNFNFLLSFIRLKSQRR